MRNLEEILNRSHEPMPFEDWVRDAKIRLLEARLHSPIVRQVCDTVWACGEREKWEYREEDLYAILALDLLRAHTEAVNAHADYVAKNLCPVVLHMPHCIHPRVEASTRWQRFCLKLGGMA